MFFNANILHLLKVSFVRGRPLSKSSMVVHTNQGLSETTILDVECEGGVGDLAYTELNRNIIHSNTPHLCV